MAEYRAYILDEDAHVSSAIEFVGADDETAKKIRQAIRRWS